MNTKYFTVERWHSQEGHYIALVKRGRKNLRMVVQGYPVSVVTRPLSEERYLTPLAIQPARAARKMREFGRHGNATAGALCLLKEAMA